MTTYITEIRLDGRWWTDEVYTSKASAQARIDCLKPPAFIALYQKGKSDNELC